MKPVSSRRPLTSNSNPASSVASAIRLREATVKKLTYKFQCLPRRSSTALSSGLLQRLLLCAAKNIALRDLSLTVGAGEHVAILGPNGCGKSTLIKTITRECYSAGAPGKFGRDSRAVLLWNVFDLRSMLGIVSNDLMTQCTREITGFDVVLSGFFSSIGIWPNPRMRHRRNAGQSIGGTGICSKRRIWP